MTFPISMIDGRLLKFGIVVKCNNNDAEDSVSNQRNKLTLLYTQNLKSDRRIRTSGVAHF